MLLQPSIQENTVCGWEVGVARMEELNAHILFGEFKVNRKVRRSKYRYS